MPRAKKKSKETIEGTIQNDPQEVEEKVDTEVLDRSPEQFSRKFQSILYSEPKHLVVAGFYLILITALVLGLWSYFSVVNKSYVLGGQVIHINPELSLSPESPFEFNRHLVHIGGFVREGDPVFEYYDSNRNAMEFNSPISGTVSKKFELKRGVKYPAGTEVMNLRPEDKEPSVKLEVPDNILNKVKEGNYIIYHFNFPLSSTKQLVTGSVITEPVLENEKYVVVAKIDKDSIKFLEGQNVKLIDGMVLTAEIVIGKERLLSRFLGVSL